jgi:predicted nuclease with TOPRIM domain
MISKEEIVKAIKTRLEMLREDESILNEAKESFADRLDAYTYAERIDELETLLEYIENPRIK